MIIKQDDKDKVCHYKGEGYYSGEVVKVEHGRTCICAKVASGAVIRSVSMSVLSSVTRVLPEFLHFISSNRYNCIRKFYTHTVLYLADKKHYKYMA